MTLDQESTEVETVVTETEADSPSDSGKDQSVLLSAIQKRLDDFAAQLEGMKKGTDKVNDRVEKRVNEVLSNPNIARILELSSAGKSQEEIEERLLLDEWKSERLKARSETPAGGGETPDGGSGLQAKKIAEEFGLDANDSAVTAAISKGDIVSLTRMAIAKAKLPQPDSSTSPPLEGKIKKESPADQKALQKEYDKRIESLKAKRALNSTSIARLKQEMRHKGLDIY